MTSYWTRIGFGPTCKVKLDVIDHQDRVYDIFRSNGSRLIASLNAAGIECPILLEHIGGDAHRVLSGFRRLDAAKSLNWREVPARILNSDADGWNAFKHIFWTKTHRHEPHPVELAGIVTVAKRLNLPPRSCLEDILAPLGQAVPDKIMSLVWKLAGFPREFRRRLLCYSLSFRQVERFVLLAGLVLEKLAVWGEVLRLRNQELLEVGEQLGELYRQLPESQFDLWVSKTEVRILDSECPRDECLIYLKNQLDLALRPTLHAIRDRKREAYNQLDLPEGIELLWDRDLEREDVTVSLSVKHLNDLDRLCNVLSNPGLKQGIAKLLASHE
jgi:hypothetical protein